MPIKSALIGAENGEKYPGLRVRRECSARMRDEHVRDTDLEELELHTDALRGKGVRPHEG